MHISKEFLLEAVGLSLVVALILISMQIFQRAVKITSLLENDQKQMLTELEEYEIVKFDGIKIDGMTAVSYIKKMTEIYELPVHVTTGKGDFTVAKQAQFAGLRDVNSEHYINPFAMFLCQTVRDENEVITEIKIEMEKEGK